MSELETIENEVRELPAEQALKLQDWLADYLEDEAELTPEFVASIARGQTGLCEGKVRRRPRQGWAEALAAVPDHELERDQTNLVAFRETPHNWDRKDWEW